MFRTAFVLSIAAFTTSALAWQGMLASLAWTDQDKSSAVRQSLLDDGISLLPGTYQLKRTVKDAWSARPVADRVALIRELAAAAKSYIMAPAFEMTWNAWIRERYTAVDHGIKVDPQSDMQAMMQDPSANQMMTQAAAQMAQEFLKLPLQSLELIFPADLKSWQRSRDPKKQALFEKAKAIEPLLKSNPDEFRKQYTLLKSAEIGGPTTWAALQSAGAAARQSQEDQKKRQEQVNYDQHRLRPTLKKKLNDFAALVRTVDFAAQTQIKSGIIVFVNPAYEQKSRA